MDGCFLHNSLEVNEYLVKAKMMCGAFDTPKHWRGAAGLHVEYVEREERYGILFMFSLFCE